VQPSGAKLWRWDYRYAAKRKTMSFGPYPEVGLAAARDACIDARRILRTGDDPMEMRKADKRERLIQAGNSFQSAAESWFSIWSKGRSEQHRFQVWRRLETDVFPSLGPKPVSSITAPEIVRVVQAIEKRGVLDLAYRQFQKVSQILRHSVVLGWVERNVAAEVRPADFLPPKKAKNHARVSAKELPGLLRGIEAYQGTPVTRLAMKIMALTFVRTSELREAPWSEVDLDRARWEIPADRMKMPSPHIIPLSRQAVEAFRVLKIVTGAGQYVFPGDRDRTKCMSNNTILKALERMGYKGMMTGHGFRGVASTQLHEMGYDHDHIELQLAHMERDEVSAAYNYAQYLQPRAEMMQAWADFLDECLHNP